LFCLRIKSWTEEDVLEKLMKKDIATDEMFKYCDEIQRFLKISGYKIADDNQFNQLITYLLV
jgi:hypothetical protein